METVYTRSDQVPSNVRRIADSEEGTWRRIDASNNFEPEFAGVTMTLAEVIDHFGGVTPIEENA